MGCFVGKPSIRQRINASWKWRIACLIGQPAKIAHHCGRAEKIMQKLCTLTAICFFAAPVWASLGIDVSVSADRGTANNAVSTAAFSTASGNELLLAFVAMDYHSGANTTVTGVTGGGLNWALVARSNVQSGSSEIWRAFAPSPLSGATVSAALSQKVQSTISVVSFTGADTTGVGGSGAIGATATANGSSGAPSASLTTTRAGSFVFGVGNDFDNAIPRTLGAAQTLIHQFLSPAGDTYWVQRQNGASPQAGTVVTINDSAPTSDRFNLSICEIIPSTQVQPTWGISGTISPAAAANGATVSLSGAASGSTPVSGSGAYSFTGLVNGSYTVTPANSGFSFTPPSSAVNVSGANVSGINFTGQTSVSSNLGIDVSVSSDRGTASLTVISPSFSTGTGNELLLAMISADYLKGNNTTVSGVLGGGLTWTLVARSNGQTGTAEIWKAFAAAPLASISVTATLSQSVLSSLTVMSFTGVDPLNLIGATASKSAGSGAPSNSLVTTRNGSWVIGVGSDYDNAISRTLGPSQTLVHQYLTSAGDTYWVQMQTTPTPGAGTTVTINDTAPTGDSYNLSICEIMPSLSGGGGNPTPPSVSVNSPAANALVADQSSFWATASDNAGIAGVQFFVDGTPVGPQITTRPYSFTWNSHTVMDGNHTVAAQALNVYGLTTLSSPLAVTVDNSGQPASVGSWSPVVSLPAVAVNLILLKNNKILFFQDGSSATVWDYLNNSFLSTPVSVNLFCSGQTALADGRILVVGGYGGSGSQIGIANAEIFDPDTNRWTSVPNMSYRRWYPNASALPDGRVLVTAGWQTTNHTNAGIPEIYDPTSNAWTRLTNANNPFETYPFIFSLADGSMLHAGESEYASLTDVLNIGSQSWSTVDPNVVDGGSSTMYLLNKIMKSGSASDSQFVGPSSNTTFVLDMTQPAASWVQTPSMAYPRSFMNLTELPDGSVLATGGETDKNGGNIANAVYAAELWRPGTQTWTTMATMKTPREYHGTALLLPDGRVLESGMGADFGNVPDELNAEFFSPPYLFQGPRPTITQAPQTITYGVGFVVSTPDASSIASAVLIRTGAVTHFFDQSTRFVPLTFQQATGQLTLQAPADSTVAPAGYYMLFLINNAGVPSVAPIIGLQ